MVRAIFPWSRWKLSDITINGNNNNNHNNKRAFYTIGDTRNMVIIKDNTTKNDIKHRHAQVILLSIITVKINKNREKLVYFSSLREFSSPLIYLSPWRPFACVQSW